MDNFTNFAKGTVSTGYDASATSIVLSTGHGARFPAAASFNATWWNSTDYADPSDDPNREIVRVTAISTDTLTVTRGQEGIAASTKNTSGKTYRMVAGLTAKTLGEFAFLTGNGSNLLTIAGGITFTGAQTIATSSGNLTLAPASGGGVDVTVSGAVITFQRTGTNGGGSAGVVSIKTDAKTASDGLILSFAALDSGNASQNYTQLISIIASPTAGSENGTFSILNVKAGTMTEQVTVLGSLGNIGFGQTSPTAVLHLKAGTATASTAPLKLTTGTVLTTAEAGAMEYNNTFHLTNSDATRRHVVLAPNTTKVTAAAPYTNDGYVVMNIGGTDFKVMTTA